VKRRFGFRISALIPSWKKWIKKKLYSSLMTSHTAAKKRRKKGRKEKLYYSSLMMSHTTSTCLNMLNYYLSQKLKFVWKGKFDHLINTLTLLFVCGLKFLIETYVWPQTLHRNSCAGSNSLLIVDAQHVEYLIEMGGELTETGIKFKTSAQSPC